MRDDALETRILSRLQERKRGQTVAQLKQHLGERRESLILTALTNLQRDGYVRVSGSVWTFNTDAAK